MVYNQKIKFFLLQFWWFFLVFNCLFFALSKQAIRKFPISFSFSNPTISSKLTLAELHRKGSATNKDTHLVFHQSLFLTRIGGYNNMIIYFFFKYITLVINYRVLPRWAWSVTWRFLNHCLICKSVFVIATWFSIVKKISLYSLLLKCCISSASRCHVSCVMCHVSCVRCHMSHVNLLLLLLLLLFLFFVQSDGAIRWRVWYQRGLPCLVSTH